MSNPPHDPISPSVLSPSAPKVSRRRFGRGVATAALLSAGNLLSGVPPSDAASTASPDPSGLPADQSPEVEAKLANIVRKYGDRLSTEQREHLRRILAYNEKMLTSIRSFPVQNGDSPASVLKVSFADESHAPKREPR